ncbi:MAG: alpha/beta hydrolase, partial [Saprospiraceae bacterium]|nr:alpha/beta hydrolase [Saprospiraceae bacterium]
MSKISLFFSSILLLLPALSSCLCGQDIAVKNAMLLEGYWEGAKIKANAYQSFSLHFTCTEEKIEARYHVPDFLPVFTDFRGSVEIDSLGRIFCPIWFGDMKLTLDTSRMILSGYQPGSSPQVSFQLRKRPMPTANTVVQDVKVQNGSITLDGHLHLPRDQAIKSAVIFVRGRGCVDVSSQFNGYAKLLSQFGIAVLSYHKRGTGTSTGDCENANLDELVSDLRSIHSYLRNHPLSFEHIGVIGSSAGAWVAARAAEQTDFDFMISMVGPSTSVYEQQMQSLEYGLEEFGLTAQDEADLIEFTELSFNAPVAQSTFDTMQQLLTKAKSNGWIGLLEGSDIPNSPGGIDSLWVRRHRYDPRASLSDFKGPMLAIFGGNDWIVPYKENIARLSECFSQSRAGLLTTVVAPNAGHGLYELPSRVELGDMQSYWYFGGVPPVVRL